MAIAVVETMMSLSLSPGINRSDLAPTTCQKPVSTQAQITHDSVKLTRVSEDMYAARWVLKLKYSKVVAFGYIAHALKT
jgi:hypothetical protein